MTKTKETNNKYISFGEMSLWCKKVGLQKEERCPHCGKKILVCLSYGGLCHSLKCAEERNIWSDE